MIPSRSLYSLILATFVVFASVIPVTLLAQVAKTSPAALDATTPHRVPGIVYVQFREGYHPLLSQGQGLSATAISAMDGVQQIFQEIGVTRIEPFDADAWKNKVSHEVGIDRMYRVYYSSNAHPLGVTLRLLQTGSVETASPQYIFSPQAFKKTPNDPGYSQQWYLDTIHAPEAWDLTMGDPSIVIADVDEGVNYNHEDLKDNMLGIGWNADGNVPDAMPAITQNEGAHGTETTGCFGAVLGNGKGMAGVAPLCKILAVKIANPAGQLTAGYEGIHYAATHGAKVINCSWGGTVDASAIAFEQKFADEVTKNNEVLVASAGNYAKNNDITPFYPSNLTGALSVGASNLVNRPTSFTHFGTSVLCYAPGENIATTDFPGNTSYVDYNGGGNGGIAGTSFSGPIVAGICALVMSYDNTLPSDAVKKIVIETGDPMDAQGKADLFPGKKANAFSAVNSVKSPSHPSVAAVGYKLNSIEGGTLDQYDADASLDIKFKNSQATAENGMKAVLLAGPGYTWYDYQPQFEYNWPFANLGRMDQKENNFFSLSKSIRRSQQFSEGNLRLRFAISDGVKYQDTTEIFVPLTKRAGMEHRIKSAHATCLKQLDARNAWAGFGYWLTIYDPEAKHDTTFKVTQFARRSLIGSTKQSRWDGWPHDITDASAPALTLDAIDSMHAWFGGASSVQGAGSHIMFTNDGGETWYEGSGVNANPRWIHFTDALNGTFVSDAVNKQFPVYTTVDGGENWTSSSPIAASTNNEKLFYNGAYWSGDTCWFGGDAGVVHLSQNRGSSWISTALPTTNTKLKHITSIAFSTNQSFGVAVVRPDDERFTDSAAIFVSIGTKGKSWVQIDILDPTTGNTDLSCVPYSVTFKPGTDTAILSTNHGVFLVAQSGNGSKPYSWKYLAAPSSWDPSFSVISAAGNKNEYTISGASEGSGIVEFTTSALAPPAGVKAEHSISKMDVIASPNPSNGSSQIYFSLASEEVVKISLVDVLGRSVKQVFSGFLPSGDHIVAVDASQLMAGTYRCIVETAHGVTGEANIVLMH